MTTQPTDTAAQLPVTGPIGGPVTDRPHRHRWPWQGPRKPAPVEFHGAWLGAGAGTTVGAFIIGLIQTYITHKALPGFLVTGIDGLCAAGVAALGSWLAHISKGNL